MSKPALPLAEVRIFDPGAGDGILTDPGHDWWHNLLGELPPVAQTKDVFAKKPSLWQDKDHGTFSIDSTGQTELELLPEVGLALRPIVVAQDTLIANWVLTGDTWAQVNPVSGEGWARVQWLSQSSVAGNGSCTAQTTWDLVEDPSFVLVLNVPEPPADQTTPSVVWAKFGAGMWALRLHSQRGLELMRWSTTYGQLMPAESLQENYRAGGINPQAKSLAIMVRCLAGKVCVSTDNGQTYTVHANEDGTEFRVYSGPMRLEAYGWAPTFGLWQVKYLLGSYVSPKHRTRKKRADASPPTISEWDAWYPKLDGVTPCGTITLSHEVPSDGLTERDTVQYEAIISQDLQEGGPWDQYRSPVLQSVLVSYPVTADAPSGTYTTPWANYIEEIRVDKPEQLDQSTATIRLCLPTAAALFDESWRFRKIAILLGDILEDSTDTSAVRFTGYIVNISIVQEQESEVLLDVTCENATAPLRHSEWETVRPFGSLIGNDALDAILDSILPGLATDWDTGGDSIVLPAGSVESPAYLTALGDIKWELFAKIAAHMQMEPGALDDGTLYTVTKDFVQAALGHTWYAGAGGTEVEDIAQRLSHIFDAAEGASVVIVIGQDAAGREIRSYVDTGREVQAVPDADFAPWRMAHVETVSESTTEARLSEMAVALFDDLVPLRFESDVQGPVKTSLSRRDRVRIVGSLTGIGDAVDYYVRTLSHVYKGGPGREELITTAGLRKVT